MPFVDIHCPYCGEPIELFVDPGVIEDADATPRYTEDCQVCCKPIDIAVSIDDEGEIAVIARAESEG